MNKKMITRCFTVLFIVCIGMSLNLTAFGKETEATDGAGEVRTIQPEVSENLFGIASVSKMFGAAAVMKLVDQGKIDLDVPLVEYIPEFEMADERYLKITPKMLLNHSSGLMGMTIHNAFLFGDSDKSYHDSFLENLKGQRLKAEPGAFSVYCNDGFTLAEILVERVSGISFSDFIAKEITKPLKMVNTYSSGTGINEEARAPVFWGEYELPYENIQCLASGGLYSTAEDLCKFSQIFMQGKQGILSEEAVAIMAEPWYLQDQICAQDEIAPLLLERDSQFGYGLGWDSVNVFPFNRYGITALTKGGDSNGYHAGFLVLPEHQLSAAVVSSGGSSAYCEQAASEIVLEVLKEEGLIEEIKELKLDQKAVRADIPEEMEQYAGYYSSNNILEVSFAEDGTLLLSAADGEYDVVQEYVYTADGNFKSTKGYYIDFSGKLVSSEDGKKGITELYFKKEKNNETYMYGKLFETAPGGGQSAVITTFGQKFEANVLEEKVRQAWKEREGKGYFLVGEKYNSVLYIDDSTLEVHYMEEPEGYIESTGRFKSSKITGPSTARCEMEIPGIIGRDLTDYHCTSVGGVEYITVGDMKFMREEGMKPTAELMNQDNIVLNQDTQWYSIAKEEEGREITIEEPDSAGYYIYDKDDNCIASSLFKETASSVILPKEGHIVLAGNKGSVFKIQASAE